MFPFSEQPPVAKTCRAIDRTLPSRPSQKQLPVCLSGRYATM